jgi:GTPase SAR1 family protein
MKRRSALFVDVVTLAQASGYVLVYDVTNKESFEHLRYWLGEVKKNGDDNMPKMLVGNKCGTL